MKKSKQNFSSVHRVTLCVTIPPALLLRYGFISIKLNVSAIKFKIAQLVLQINYLEGKYSLINGAWPGRGPFQTWTDQYATHSRAGSN